MTTPTNDLSSSYSNTYNAGGILSLCLVASFITAAVVGIKGLNNSMTPDLMAKITFVTTPIISVISFGAYIAICTNPPKEKDKAKTYTIMAQCNFVFLALIPLAIFALKSNYTSKQFGQGIIGILLFGMFGPSFFLGITKSCCPSNSDNTPA